MLKSTDKINVSQMLNSAINFNQFRNISATSPLHLRFIALAKSEENHYLCGTNSRGAPWPRKPGRLRKLKRYYYGY